jgi:transcriptional regulator with XRE-family HTH domain
MNEQRRLAPTPIDRLIGSKITQARLRGDMSISDLAERLGVSEVEIAGFEAGRIRIPAHRLAQIARLLNQKIAWFFDQVQRSIELPIKK